MGTSVESKWGSSVSFTTDTGALCFDFCGGFSLVVLLQAVDERKSGDFLFRVDVRCIFANFSKSERMMKNTTKTSKLKCIKVTHFFWRKCD